MRQPGRVDPSLGDEMISVCAHPPGTQSWGGGTPTRDGLFHPPCAASPFQSHLFWPLAWSLCWVEFPGVEAGRGFEKCREECGGGGRGETGRAGASDTRCHSGSPSTTETVGCANTSLGVSVPGGGEGDVIIGGRGTVSSPALLACHSPGQSSRTRCRFRLLESRHRGHVQQKRSGRQQGQIRSPSDLTHPVLWF